jgi:hypothetical protein
LLPSASPPSGDLRLYAETLRYAFNEHVQSAAVHFTPDRTNIVAYQPRSGAKAETWALLNAIKAATNAHFGSALASAPVEEP